MVLAAEDEDEAFVSPRARSTRAPISSSQAVRAIVEMKELQARFRRLESQLNQSMNNETFSKALSGENDHNDVDETGNFGCDALTVSLDETSATSEIVPRSIERTWSEFMNKRAGEDAEFAIEILKGDPSYYHPAKSLSKTSGRTEGVTLKDAAAVTEAVKRTLQVPDTPSSPSEGQHCIPDRIRINSPYILSTLSGIDKHVDSSGPMVMLRPFKFLVHHASRIDDAVGLLRRRAGEESPDNNETTTIQTTLQHMECLIDFYNDRIRPTVDALCDDSRSTIAFRDLWYLFPNGVDIFMPLRRLRGSVFRDAMDATPDTFLRRYNMLWRVVSAGGGRPNLSASRNHENPIKLNSFRIQAYYVDYDGKFFIPTIHEFAILPYSGERDISSLDFFPVRFLKDGSERVLDHTEQGKKTFAAIAAGFTHFYYAGLTMVTQPCGCSLQETTLHQEWIESEVVVDFKATLLRHPSWRPKATLWSPPPRHESEIREQSAVRYWKDKTHRHLETAQQDFVFDDYVIDRERSLIFKEQEPIFAPVPSGWASNAEMVPQKDVGLLAGRAFGFVLRTRSFGEFYNLWCPPNIFGSLC